MRRRVVITGVGSVTALGGTARQTWDGLVQGRSGVGPLTLFDASQFPVRIAAEVRGWSLRDVGENPRLWAHCPRQTRFVIGAAKMAFRDAVLENRYVNPTRFGVYLGCGEPFEDFERFTRSICESSRDTSYDPDAFTETALRIFDPDMEREYDPSVAARHLAGLFDAQGPNANCIAACVSAAQAIGESARLIRRGSADIMMCGGAHSTIHPFGVTGFQRLSALSMRNDDPGRAVRPFDRERDGFVIGEGGAVLILEDLEHARSRNAPILAELTGYGSAQDAFRITDSHPEGRGTRTAIRRALDDAHLDPDDIDYVNAHGTGTVMNDQVETAAIKAAFGTHAQRLPISSSKSMIGHTTTACGAIELSICVMALQHRVVPPTINYEQRDPLCDLDYVPNTARELECRHVMSDSIGFGGQNAALIVSRFDEPLHSSISLSRAA